MKLKWVNQDVLPRNLKATIHKTGKLGFTKDAAEYLMLSNKVYASIAIDEESSDGSLYINFHSESKPEYFKVSKAGEYFYINTIALFDFIGVNYTDNQVIFDIKKQDSLFKFAIRK